MRDDDSSMVGMQSGALATPMVLASVGSDGAVVRGDRACFFGPRGRRLFGVFEDPQQPSRGQGVVLCYPIGADYGSAFRAYRVLGTRLTQAGFHVLRFDYTGTGDSWGDDEHVSIRQWIADVREAVTELRASRGVRDVALAGLRLGGTLAALAAPSCDGVDQLVLWEPVTDGAAFLAEQATLHREWIREERRSARAANAVEGELLGWHPTASLRSELSAVRLQSIESAPAPQVHIVAHARSKEHERLILAMQFRGAAAELAVVDAPNVWSKTPAMPDPAVPSAAIQAIVRSLTGARA